MGLRVQRVTCRAFLVLTVTLYAIGTAIAVVVMGSLLRLQMGELQANVSNDSEKRFLDDCMRDYENLNPSDATYKAEYTKCIEELRNDESLKRLPHIRLTVDDRVCDPVDLCSGGDPGQCGDTGAPRTEGYQPGDVTKCYLLIDNAKAEQDAFKKAELLDRVAAECTSKARWEDHEKKVKLAYCFWKHLQTGVCTNNMRTNCPIGASSCCPIAQNDPLTVAQTYRPDQYICQKSPIVGLYCQHKDYRVPVNKSIQPEGPLCTQVTCPSFGWCRDLADIPGQCLGEACKDYSRALDFLIVCIVFVGLGLVFDFIDLILLIRWPMAVKQKSGANAVSACLKLLAYLLCAAGGVQDFTHELVEQSCFNVQGNELAQSAKDGVKLFQMVTLLTIVGSLVLAPMSAMWGGQLVGLPYARVH